MQQVAQGDISTSVSNSDTIPSQVQFGGQRVESTENRYSKNKLLDIFRAQQNSEGSNSDVTKLFMNNWDPGHSNGINGRGWGKGSDSRDHSYGPDVCWDQTGQNQPIGLEEMSALERSVSVLFMEEFLDAELGTDFLWRYQFLIEATASKY